TPGSAGDVVAIAVGSSVPAAGPLAVDLGVSPSADHARTARTATTAPVSRADRLMSANMGHLPCGKLANQPVRLAVKQSRDTVPQGTYYASMHAASLLDDLTIAHPSVAAAGGNNQASPLVE